MRLIEVAIAALEDGKPARTAEIDEDDKKAWKMLQLLTSKPVLYVANVDEDSAATGNDFSAKVVAHAEAEGAQAVIISAQIESEMAVLDDEEQAEYLDAIGLKEPGKRQNAQALFTVISRKASSGRKQRPMKTMSKITANKVQKKLAKFAKKAKNMWSKTAISCCLSSTYSGLSSASS